MSPAGARRKAAHEEEELPEDLAAMKRRFEAMGYSVQFPGPGATWREPEPLDLKGDSASDVVIRLRGNDV